MGVPSAARAEDVSVFRPPTNPPRRPGGGERKRARFRRWRVVIGGLALVCLVILVPEGQGGGSAVADPAPAPAVTSIDPLGGPTGGGTSVTVTGTDLAAATSVDFGSAPAAVTEDSDTSITVTSPPGVLGSVDITVTTAGGTSATSAADQFTYVPAPTVTGVSPGSGPSVSGALITVTGTNFLTTAADGRRLLATGVSFGATPASSFEIDSATTITAATPCLAGSDCPTQPDSSGTTDVTVTNLGGTSPTSPADQFAYDLSWRQGTVTGLPTTSSAVSVSARPSGPDPNLTVSVNQTQNLTDQAISVSWTGGVPTTSDSSGDFLGNYLQMFECWSDPSASSPSPSQCEFGGESPSTSNYPIDQDDAGESHEFSRVLAQPGWSTDSPEQACATATGPADPCTDELEPDATDFMIQPFEAADGTIVRQQADYNYDLNQNAPGKFWLNPYFSFDTTNEVDFARTLSGGTGQQLFDVDTGLNAPGLGCGQTIQSASGSGSVTPKCWLVIVPRGLLNQENPAGLSGVSSVVTSPLTSAAWANKIAIPLEFNPVGSTCSINASSQEIEGSELAAPAVSSWEPELCDLPDAQPYSYLQNDDDQARENLVDPTYGSVGLSVFSDPIPSDETSPTNPVVYAPLTLSGAVIAFNIQRVPVVEPDGTLQPDAEALANSRVQNIYLTPRLVAKLLTESYQAELKGVARTTNPKYQWVQNNPVSLFDDPDFLQYNPEFELLSTTQQLDAATLVVEEGSSDASSTLWKWVLSDPAARAWLDGTPTPDGKPGGMQVNPIYSINPTINPSHVAFGSPSPESYPKSDPWCDPTVNKVNGVDGNPPQPARQICVQDWSPYVGSRAAAALAAANANDGGKTTFNPANTPDTAWTSNGPEITGNDLIISVTDSASAARYGLQTASLSPAGDDANPTFVSPDSADLLAGEQAMAPSSVPGVLQTDPSSTATDAYPLTMLTYAAATPEVLNQSSRQNYAAFLRYAVGQGQVPGVQPGDLPVGYDPLPASLVAETLAAANTILHPPVFPSATKSSSSTNGGAAVAGSGSLGSGGSNGEFSSSSSTNSGSSKRLRPERKLGPAALSAVRVNGLPIGVLRWVLPILLLIGVLAALGALALRMTGKKVAPVGASTDPTAEELGTDPS